jgi:hypothetical protein
MSRNPFNEKGQGKWEMQMGNVSEYRERWVCKNESVPLGYRYRYKGANLMKQCEAWKEMIKAYERILYGPK